MRPARLRPCHSATLSSRAQVGNRPRGVTLNSTDTGRNREGLSLRPGMHLCRAPPSASKLASFSNQVLAQIELFTAPSGKDEKRLYTLPKQLDEKVAALHLAKVGATLTKLTSKQSEYIGIAPQGPFKHELYRY